MRLEKEKINNGKNKGCAKEMKKEDLEHLCNQLEVIEAGLDDVQDGVYSIRKMFMKQLKIKTKDVRRK